METVEEVEENEWDREKRDTLEKDGDLKEEDKKRDQEMAVTALLVPLLQFIQEIKLESILDQMFSCFNHIIKADLDKK